MKPALTKQYPYAGDYYSYTLRTSADGTITERVYAGVPTQAALALSVNLLGDLVIESESKFQINSYLKNVLDRNGEQIYVDGVWEIYQTAPLLSALGTKEGYRYRARLIDGLI
jgi:hypothetical protein